jgi:biopolymer transport protein ExbD
MFLWAKRKDVEEAEVPLSSMIDVVFLLLIYFIVTQKPIIDETLLSCDLPTPGGKPPKTPPTMLTVEVLKMFPNPSGTETIRKKDLNTYYLNKRKWKFKDPGASNDLRRQLIAIAENDPDQTIIINCGPNAEHQKLVQILDACSEAGLTKLNVVNDESIKFVPVTAPKKYLYIESIFFNGSSVNLQALSCFYITPCLFINYITISCEQFISSDFACINEV